MLIIAFKKYEYIVFCYSFLNVTGAYIEPSHHLQAMLTLRCPSFLL